MGYEHFFGSYYCLVIINVLFLSRCCHSMGSGSVVVREPGQHGGSLEIVGSNPGCHCALEKALIVVLNCSRGNLP